MWQRWAISPQLYFIGEKVVAYAGLHTKHLGLWGAELEGVMPVEPLKGLAFLSHCIADYIDEDGKLGRTTEGHTLWMRFGKNEEVWFWEDGKDVDFRLGSDMKVDLTFLVWHLAKLEQSPVP